MKKYAPGIFLKEFDLSTATVSTTGCTNTLFNSTEKGPQSEPILIYNKIRPIEWYEIWRYHLIPAYNREVKRCKQEFIDIFGQPDNTL